MAIGDHVKKALAEKAAREQAHQPEEIVDPVATPEPAAPATVTMSMADIQALVSSAIKAAKADDSMADVAKAITDGIAQARTPRPENANTPEISDLNPFGDRDHPRPGLKCDWWWGVIDDKTKKAQRSGYEIDPNSLTAWEQLALNLLEPVQKTIKRLDKADMPVTVAAEYNDVGGLVRMILALPAALVSKKGENKNMVPDITDIVRQITGHDVRRDSLSDDETLRLMAAHRQKQYDVPRKAVAA